MTEPMAESGDGESQAVDQRLDIEPLDASIDSIQPGGGFCMRVELAWGGFRRWTLRSFRRGYVKRMAALRQGEESACPHPVLDPRVISVTIPPLMSPGYFCDSYSLRIVGSTCFGLLHS